LHVVIIGNGITGATAALELRRLDADCRITMISGESRFHYSRPALMYIFMGHMSYRDTKPHQDHTWADNRIDLVRAWITAIDTDSRQLILHGSGDLAYDKLLIATGAKSNKFGWPGQEIGRASCRERVWLKV
jgi:NADH dehydrogenase FAD-containing subunit